MSELTLKHQWMPVATEKEITHRPKRFFLLGIPLVIVRLNNTVVALQDRCPHRGAPLSAGQVKDGLLQCPYHGWRFNASGECALIPGLTKSVDCTNKQVASYEVTTHFGLIFVCLKKNETTLPLYVIPSAGTEAYPVYIAHTLTIEGNILNIIENALDATHTNFVHKGLLRHDNKRQSITAQLSVNLTCAEVRYEENQKQSGLVSSLFEKGRAFSFGRFHAPLIAELEYHSSNHLTAIFTLFFSPTTLKNEYRLFLLITHRKTWFPSWIKKLLILPFIRTALEQDKRMLKKQRMNLACFPDGHFQSTELDLLRPHIQRILEKKSVHYKKTVVLYI